ncbi:Regulator of microtubule dynamics protein 2, partial [Galemys pyrenaicus]
VLDWAGRKVESWALSVRRSGGVDRLWGRGGLGATMASIGRGQSSSVKGALGSRPKGAEIPARRGGSRRLLPRAPPPAPPLSGSGRCGRGAGLRNLRARGLLSARHCSSGPARPGPAAGPRSPTANRPARSARCVRSGAGRGAAPGAHLAEPAPRKLQPGWSPDFRAGGPLNKKQAMPHSTNKELIFGIMVGTTGISLLLLWYHKVRKPRTAINIPNFLSLGNTLDSIAFQDEMHNSQGTVAIFQRKQLQILEKLNEVLMNMEALKEEIRVLKETIPKLEEYIQGELGGKITVHKISPQHRARKRRLATVQSSATSNSSEEAESEGGCCKEDRNFLRKRQKHRADQVTSNLEPKAPSKAYSATRSRLKKTRQPPSRRKNNSAKGNEVLASSDVSTSSSFSKKRRSLSLKFQKSNTYLYRQQSRANFDSQENISVSDLRPSQYFSFKSLKLFSNPRVSMVTCYEDSSNFDLQSNSWSTFIPNEGEIVSRNSRIADVRKYTSPFLPEYSTMHLMVETRVNYSPQRIFIEKSTYQQNTGNFNSLLTVTGFSPEQSGILFDTEERDQLRNESLYFDSQRHGTNYSTALIQQHPSQSVTSLVLNVGFSSFYKNGSGFTHLKITLTQFPLKYITANTDTEEQSFPVPQAFNTQIEELNLDVLLQKADNLRMDESSKIESFELLCDHKEKFRDEIEFIWRFVRAYGDMCELSTDIKEKKHYANIGKTLGEKAISRAPMNGYCHLWYAVLCGHVSEFESLQNKVSYGQRFKDHLDKAIEFIPEEPYLYYLKGRYCYTVSKLSWLEKKMAATLFGKIPSSTVEEALQNFLKVEELSPSFSKSNYMYLAKCYIDIEQKDEALKYCNLALLLPCVTNETMAKVNSHGCFLLELQSGLKVSHLFLWTCNSLFFHSNLREAGKLGVEVGGLVRGEKGAAVSWTSPSAAQDIHGSPRRMFPFEALTTVSGITQSNCPGKNRVLFNSKHHSTERYANREDKQRLEEKRTIGKERKMGGESGLAGHPFGGPW